MEHFLAEIEDSYTVMYRFGRWKWFLKFLSLKSQVSNEQAPGIESMTILGRDKWPGDFNVQI